jgi:NADH-quinone oxidoreductase subunit M
MFRMLQRVVWGRPDNPDHSSLTDLSVREIVTLAPLLFFVLWIGLSPEPFMNVMHTSVNHLLQQVGYNPEGTVSVAKLMLPNF